MMRAGRQGVAMIDTNVAGGQERPALQRVRDYMPKALQSTIKFLLAGLIFVSVFVAYVPLYPMMPSGELDFGWMLGIDTAVSRHFVFGRDLLFTYGPFAAVQTTLYSPGTDTLMLCGSVVVTSALALALAGLSRGVRVAIAVVVANCIGLTWSRDPIGYLMPIMELLLVSHMVNCERRETFTRVAAIAGIVALGLLVLIKSSYGAGAVIALAFSAALLLRRRRVAMAAVLIVLFPASIAMFWIAAGQPLSALPGYFIACLPIISGYGQAMQYTADPRLDLICAAATLAVIAILQVDFGRRLGADGLLISVGIALVLALSLKAGLVRGDLAHILIDAGTLVLVALVLALVLPARLAVLVGTIGTATWFVVMTWVAPETPAILVQEVRATWLTGIVGLSDRLSHPEQLKLRYDAALADIRRANPLPKVAGTADIYGYGQAILIANQIDWSPRPVLQSYSAYTPGLEAMDRAHLLGGQAPQTIFFRVETIDNRLPALDDGTSWPVLLTRYRVMNLFDSDTMAMLSRRDESEAAEAGVIDAPPILDGRFKLRRPVPLPKIDSPLWAVVDLQPNLLGRALDALYKLPIVTITLTGDNGEAHLYRFVPQMGAAGFIISPLVSTTRDFVALSVPDGTGVRPNSVAISVPTNVSWLWGSTFGLKIYPLNLR
jgi:hypothetical protein